MHRQEPTEPSRFRFGLFELDLRRGELRSNGRPVRLSPQPSRLLTLLVSRPGELITRDEIRQYLWQEDTHVDFDAGLNFCIRQIRLALHDHGEAPRYIATLPKRGYRFVAPVQVVWTNGEGFASQVATSSENTAPASEGGTAKRRDQLSHSDIKRYLLPLLLLVAPMIAASPVFMAKAPRRGEMRQQIRIAVLPFEHLGARPSEVGIGEGLTDELILQLSRMGAERLAVIARTSALAYQGSPKTVEQIARELDVSYLVEGTIRSSTDGRVRIGVTLVRAADQSAIWADAWDHEAEALLPLQREVAVRVTRALALQ
ncbi:MAG: hypothetical protein GEV06_25610 [Luteitalea sp.]|nr:hypothetical protein [Luteitalea sp.]